MANLNEIEGLGNDAGFQVDYDNVPEQGGSFGPTPPPGSYRFKLPPSLEEVWEGFDAKINDQQVKRVRAVLRDTSALTITQAPPKAKDLENETFMAFITNAERKRNKEGLMASDMLYLLRSLGDDGRYSNNLEYANALKKYAGAEFIGDIEWNAWCDDRKPIRVVVENEDGSTATQLDESQNGCGARVYQSAIPKGDDGEYARQFACPDCGAVLYPRAQIARFKPVPEAK